MLEAYCSRTWVGVNCQKAWHYPTGILSYVTPILLHMYSKWSHMYCKRMAHALIDLLRVAANTLYSTAVQMVIPL